MTTISSNELKLKFLNLIYSCISVEVRMNCDSKDFTCGFVQNVEACSYITMPMGMTILAILTWRQFAHSFVVRNSSTMSTSARCLNSLISFLCGTRRYPVILIILFLIHCFLHYLTIILPLIGEFGGISDEPIAMKTFLWSPMISFVNSTHNFVVHMYFLSFNRTTLRWLNSRCFVSNMLSWFLA